MTSVFASRRRAEEFDALVEGDSPGAPRDARLLDFLQIAEELRAVPAPQPRPEFVAALRAELMSAADTLLEPAQAQRLALPARTPARDRRLAAAIGGFAVVGATASMAVAAQSALPGEMLYPLKRAIESAQTGVVSERDMKALSLLDNAASRLAEIQAMGREGQLVESDDAVAETFVDFGEQAMQAADLVLADYTETGGEDLVRQLRDFTGDSMATLAELEAQVPASARDELLAAAQVVSEIDARAEKACPDCGGTGIEQIPPVLLAAGEVADSQLVVVPGVLVEGRRTTPGRRGGTDTGEQQPPPADGPTLPSTGVVTAPEDGGGSGSGDDEGDDPLGELAGTLTDSGPTTSSGDDPVEQLDEAVEDAVDDVGETLDDTTDSLVDPLQAD